MYYKSPKQGTAWEAIVEHCNSLTIRNTAPLSLRTKEHLADASKSLFGKAGRSARTGYQSSRNKVRTTNE